MLPFELSVIDIVLAIAMVILYLLFLAGRRNETTTKSDSLVKGRKKLSEKPKSTIKTVQEKPSTTKPSTDFNCIHHFGYLSNQPKNTPVPDECFGCTKILRCLFPNE